MQSYFFLTGGSVLRILYIHTVVHRTSDMTMYVCEFRIARGKDVHVLFLYR